MKSDKAITMNILTFVTATAAVMFLAGCFGIGWVFGLGIDKEEKK